MKSIGSNGEYFRAMATPNREKLKEEEKKHSHFGSYYSDFESEKV